MAITLRTWCLVGWVATLAGAMEPADTVLMPQSEDYSHQWWAEGFPGTIPTAPWLRCLQGGRYAMVLDVRTLRIPHLGPVAPGGGYLAATGAPNDAWKALPPAELALTITTGGTTYRATAGGAWTSRSGPRLIAAGRLVQQADVTDLVFTADHGTALPVEARFETVAWPDRLGLVLSARAKRQTHFAQGATLGIRLTTAAGSWSRTAPLPATGPEGAAIWTEVGLPLDPVQGRDLPATDEGSVGIEAHGIPDGTACRITADAARGWHRIDIGGLQRLLPGGDPARNQDALERLALVLTNRTDEEQVARLLFAKEGGGYPITGVSAVLRDGAGNPTGIPVQLSKNWHGRAEDGPYHGAWFHGFSQVRLPPRSRVPLELTLAYGHWGGVAAASHAQLCLIGWGSHQQWDESALGAWGESICYEPDQVQAHCGILDVRPLMVRSMGDDGPWNWTHNVGGGDAFRLFDPRGKRVFPARMRTAYQQYGPCLTSVTYAGRLADGLERRLTVSLGRTDDLVRGTYRLRLDVHAAVDFSRFVLLQIGADTYSYTAERHMALGNEDGLTKEWTTRWGGDVDRTPPMAATGRIPWISLHDAEARRPKQSRTGAWANRGLVIRDWKARLGGAPAGPWVVEHGTDARGTHSSTIDVVPPPGVRRLEPGDFVEATVEHLVVPMAAEDYYGPNQDLRTALAASANTWRMIAREALGNDRRVEVTTGRLEARYPAVVIRAQGGMAAWTLAGGLGHVPITVTGLPAPRGWILTKDGLTVDQSVHGGDFWQVDADPEERTWSWTTTLPVTPGRTHALRLVQASATSR